MWYKHVLATELEYTLFDSGAIDMKINVSLFEKKSHAKNLVLSCNSKLQYTLFDSGAIDMKINVSLFEKKSHAKNLVLSCNSKLHWDSYTVCAAKTFGSFEALVCYKEFFFT